MAVVFHFRHAAGDDVDVVGDGKLDEFIPQADGVGGQFADGAGFAQVVVIRHQGRLEEFRKEDKVGLVVADGVDEVFYLFDQGVEVAEQAHLPLYDTDADDIFGQVDQLFLLLVIDVVPFEQGGVFFRRPFLRQVIADDLPHVEVVRKLKGEGRVVDLLEFHTVDILPRGQLVAVVFVVGNAPADDDGTQVEVFADFLAGVVQPPPQAHAAEFGMDEKFDPVQHVALRVMGAEGVVAGNLRVGMVVAETKPYPAMGG